MGNLSMRKWRVPRDGTCRYLYDIWQPFAWFALTVGFIAAFFATSDPYASMDEDDLFFCNADGKVEKADNHYRPLWDARLYFTVNVAFGQFAFSTVKVIDAAWDTVVGRGGQMVAAMVAYRTLRRSLTLMMETSTVTVPAVASMHYHQVQAISVGRLIHNMFWHWTSKRRQPPPWGRARLGTQVFVCVYVLSFATLVSIMTGYRARLTGYFGFEAEQTGQLQPTSQLTQPEVSMVVYNGTRIGRADSPIFSYDELPFLKDDKPFNISEILKSSSELEEPYGTFIDYYYTCLGLREWVSYAQETESSQYNDTISLECASHNCSCSLDIQRPIVWITEWEIASLMTSNITIDGRLWPLQAPPLSIGLASYDPQIAPWTYSQSSLQSYPRNYDTQYLNAREFWSGIHTFRAPFYMFSDWYVEEPVGNLYTTSNGTGIDRDTIKRTSRCIADDAYSWGFSSLLLLTFCIYTILFALALMVLQTDVYWNSRHDRDHQYHSMYTDVLYLAKELKAIFGGDVKNHLQSPKAFSKRVQSYKGGLRLEVEDLELSRWQERKISRTTKTVARSRRTSNILPEDLAYELGPVSSQSHDQREATSTTDPVLVSQSDVGMASSDQAEVSAAVSMSARTPASEEQELIAQGQRTGRHRTKRERGRDRGRNKHSTTTPRPSGREHV